MHRTEERRGAGPSPSIAGAPNVAPRAWLAVTGLILLAACSHPVSFDNCTLNPARVSPSVPPEDYRIAVLAPPPLRDPSDPRMVTRETGREVDYWRRYALTESSFEDYRRYRALIDAPPGGAAEFEATAWLVRPPIVPAGAVVRELRVRTEDAVGYDAICRP